ncbi:GGDEF domain-containing protein [Streptomyces sp. NPDC092296]|uniref:GGDEF domain-containing protein n=1 Tax=Streptomyces sp. NPDC092296 TaxID=3366012 RepID=UPI0038018DF7
MTRHDLTRHDLTRHDLSRHDLTRHDHERRLGMTTAVLVQALAALSLPTSATAAALGVHTARLRRRHRHGAARTAELRRRVRRLEAARAGLERTAVTDPLTGVWNYRHLQLTLDREVARHTRGERPLAVLLLDISGFEAISAAHGHHRAHAVLRDLAQRLAIEVRRADTLGRYGGEEFLVLLPDTGVEGAAQVAERLCWTVRRHRLLLPAEPPGTAPGPSGGPGAPGDAAARPGNGLTAAIGIAVLPRDGAHAATLLRAADRALRDATRAGGDCWRGAPAHRDPAAARRTPIEDSTRTQLGVSAPQ